MLSDHLRDESAMGNGTKWLLCCSWPYRAAESDAAEQISIGSQEVLPHPRGAPGGGDPGEICGRLQAIPRGVQCECPRSQSLRGTAGQSEPVVLGTWGLCVTCDAAKKWGPESPVTSAVPLPGVSCSL